MPATLPPPALGHPPAAFLPAPARAVAPHAPTPAAALPCLLPAQDALRTFRARDLVIERSTVRQPPINLEVGAGAVAGGPWTAML